MKTIKGLNIIFFYRFSYLDLGSDPGKIEVILARVYYPIIKVKGDFFFRYDKTWLTCEIVEV